MLHLCAKLACVLATAGAGLAAPHDQRYFVSFEDLPGMPLETVTMPPTPYNGLKYSNVVVVKESPTLQPLGLLTPEGENYIASSTATLTTVSTDYPGSIADSFSINSLYAACFVDAQNGATATAVDCTLDVVGTKVDGSTVNNKFTLVYTPAVAGVATTAQNLRKLTLTGFEGIAKLQLKPVQPSAILPTLIGTNADGFDYTVK